jgi:CheY-like chemotaxis protein
LARADQPGNGEKSRGTETILLVEDEEAVRELSTLVLTDLGYQLHTAANGVEALKLLDEASDLHVDLLLTDVVMPRMGGRELAERLRETRPALKILFCSGYTAESEWVSRALTKDTHFLQKPFTGVALAQKVREVLDS